METTFQIRPSFLSARRARCVSEPQATLQEGTDRKKLGETWFTIRIDVSPACRDKKPVPDSKGKEEQAYFLECLLRFNSPVYIVWSGQYI